MKKNYYFCHRINFASEASYRWTPLVKASEGAQVTYEWVYIWILNIEFFKIWDDKCLHIYFPNWKALPNASLRRRSQKMFGLKVPCLICKVTFCVKRQHIAFAPLQNFRVKWNVISSFCCLVERSFEKNFVRPNDEFFRRLWETVSPPSSTIHTTSEAKKKKAKICRPRSLGCL